MEGKPENIIVNSCEYTPIYLIQSPSVTQPGSYIIAQPNQDATKPVTNNLKNFYENSGNLESSILTNSKPRILKRHAPGIVGNNLKLASFLLPKSEPIPIKKEYIPPVNNPIVKPANTVTTNVLPTITTVPRLEVERKIVRVGAIPVKQRINRTSRIILPKIKPKVKAPIIPQNPNRHTSVQLLKLGETYHSLNQLSDVEMKIVTKALKMFGDDPEKICNVPAYDAATNTQFIYKIVSPRDLTVVGKNKIEFKKKCEMRKHREKLREEKREEHQSPPEPTVTRSGRTVKQKQPKQIAQEESPRPRKRAGHVATCFQCSTEFSSLYRLQRHYETYPTHIPAKSHSNLFHCLLAIIKGGSGDDQANMFVQQLEQLVEKLKSLLPCLLKKIDGCEGKLCTVNDDIGRLFGMTPGKYNLNVEALNCVKDKDGRCIHNPAPKQFNSDVSKPSQMWLSKHNEEIANNEAETEDCARINSVDKWPTVSKRIWKIRQQKSPKVKRIRLTSESNDQHIELETEDEVTVSNAEESAINSENNDVTIIESDGANEVDQSVIEDTSVEDQSIKPRHIEFHSTHFDIRSSPIKQSALVRKFQIDPKALSSYEVQILRPLSLDQQNEMPHDIIMQSDSDNLELFRINEMTKPCDLNISGELNFDNPKDWTPSTAPDDTHSHENYQANVLFQSTLTPIKSNEAIEPSLIHIKDKASSLFDTPTKSNSLIEPTLMQTKANNLLESSLMNENRLESNGLFETKSSSLVQPPQANSLIEPMMHFEHKPSDLFEPSSKVDRLSEPTFIEAKSSSLIEPSFMHFDDKSLFEQPPIRVKSESSLLEHTFLHSKDKRNGIYEALAHVKQRSHNLFEQTPMHKNKNIMIGPPLELMKDKTDYFETFTHTKRDSLIEPMAHLKDHCGLLQGDKTNVIIDVCQSDLNSSGQGHSVLNLFESLGNECLAYPGTEIRNNSVDFDLFSFHSS